MQRIIKNKEGFTLIEITLALAILSILVVAFLNVFSNGAITIFNAGHKSRSNVEAQAIVDRIYEETKSRDIAVLPTEIETILNDTVGAGNYANYTSNEVNFNEPYAANNKTVRYYLSNQTLLTGNSVPVLTFRMYYQQGKRFVTIISPLAK